MKSLLIFNDKKIEVEIDETLASLSTLLEYVSNTDSNPFMLNGVPQKAYELVENKYIERAALEFDEPNINSAEFVYDPKSFGYVDIVNFYIVE